MRPGADGVIRRTNSDERRAAADRVRKAIEEAKAGGYVNAWYSYIDRRDVERLLP